MALSAAAVVAKLTVQVDMQTERAASGARRIGKGLDKLTGPALAAAGAVVTLGVKAGKSASRLQQSMGAVDTVFGKSSDQVKRWADDADKAVGLSAAQYGELASTMGAQLKNMGVPMDKVAGQTNDLIRLGADLSATYGGTTAEAVEALGSALRGETDPIERYGISIKQATIEAAVGKKRLAKMTDAQARAAKTAALLGLVTKQSGKAVGAFGRESNTAAGQQQRATAAWEDASAQLGQVLLPYMTKAAEALATMAGWLSEHQTLATVLAVAIGVLAGAILAATTAVKLYTTATKLAELASKSAWRSALGPIGLVVAAIAAVVAILVVCYNKFAWFKRFVDAVWRGIVTTARWAWGTVSRVVSGAVNSVRGYVAAITRTVSSVFNAVVRVASSAWGTFKRVASSALGAVRGFIGSIVGAVRSVMSAAGSVWRRVWGRLAGPVQTAMGAARKPIDAVAGALSTVVGWVQKLIGWIGRIHWPSPPSWLSKIPGLGRMAGGSAAAPPAARVPVMAGVRGGAARVTATAGGGLTVVVNGALDPVAVASQIRRILGADERRRGVVSSGRPATAAGAL